MSKQTNKLTTFSDYCKEDGVKPIPPANTVLIKKPKALAPKAKPYWTKNNSQETELNLSADFSQQASAFSLLDEPLYHDAYCRDGQKHIIKKLQQYQIIQILDLHHFTQQNAILKLESFINGNITPGNTCLKVIHGKGLNSPDGRSVLKSLVRRFLEYHPRTLAYTKAAANNGGDGVTLIKLKN